MRRQRTSAGLYRRWPRARRTSRRRWASHLISANKQRTASLEHQLSPRELEILALVAAGETDRDIARQLFIATATVYSHLERIRDKTGARRRAQLTRLYLENKSPRGPAG